jgi:DNA-dependent RNA polymerase auxiliary subunit epsilon
MAFLSPKKTKVPKGLSKEETRDFEQANLRPAKLKKYVGPEPPLKAKKPMEKQTVRLVFKSEAEVNLFSNHFSVSTYVENSCYKLEMLVDFLKALEEGKLEYDEKSGSFTAGD